MSKREIVELGLVSVLAVWQLWRFVRRVKRLP